MKDVNILINNGANIKKALELFGDMETYDDALGTFLAEVPEKLDKIKRFKEIGDMANYAILVHSLKSDARYFGFEELGEIAYQHELKSKANDMYYVVENFEPLMKEANRVVNVAKCYMGYGDASALNSGTSVAPTRIVINAAPQQPTVSEQPVEMLNAKTILVADDTNLIVNFITSIFKNTFNVIVAHDGKEALDIINNPEKAKYINAMLLDLNMPVVNGYEVLEYFKQNDLFSKIPVSIITGADDKESITKVDQYPIIDVLLKPFNESDVKRIVERTINSKI